MCDRDPVPQWSFGRVTLLRRCGASRCIRSDRTVPRRAVLDARALAERLTETDDVEAALKAYEADRLETTSEIVRTNRSGGPERVIDMVNQRAPDGFDNIHDVASHEELEAVVMGYSQLAGFAKEDVNVAR